MKFFKKIFRAITYRPAKFLASIINVQIFKRLSTYPIHKKLFKADNVKIFSRQDVYRDSIIDTIGKSEEVTYVEFGVWKGDSLNYFVKRFSNESSTFIGLDTFEGLPEKWNRFQEGAFDTGGKVPDINDKRVKFIKGLFQNTSENLLNHLQSIKIKNLLVHMDADLYTSTLYVLGQLDRLSKDYYVFFDQFTGEESRALSDYMSSYYSKFKVIAQMNNSPYYDGYPHKLFGKIIHRNNLS